MDRFSYPSLGSLRDERTPGSSRSYPNVVPFGPVGAGQWTGHSIGLFIVFGFILIALVGMPESAYFFVVSLGLGALFGSLIRLWHRSIAGFWYRNVFPKQLRIQRQISARILAYQSRGQNHENKSSLVIRGCRAGGVSGHFAGTSRYAMETARYEPPGANGRRSWHVEHTSRAGAPAIGRHDTF